MSTTVYLDQDGSFASIRARGLPLEKFKLFRLCTEGSRYDRPRRLNLAPLDKVPSILKRLRDQGFTTQVSSALVETLQRHTAQQWLDLKAAQERITKIDAEFFARTGNRLYPFQRTGAQWLATRSGALLADEMGLGKTLQTIAAIPAGVGVLVVAPAVAKGVWVKEIAKWRPHLRVSVLRGRDSFRWPDEGEMLITNYDILPEIHDKTKCDGKLPPEPCLGCNMITNGLGMRVRAEGHKEGCSGWLDREECPGCHPFLELAPHQLCVVADEAHNLKSFNALRTKRFRALSRQVRECAGRVWLLTATPLLNNPKELWSVYQAADIAGEAFGDWKTFVTLFKGRPLYYGGYDWGTPEAEVAERIRRVALRRHRVDVLPQLPAKRWSEVTVDITDKRALKECDKFIKSIGGLAKFDELIASQKLKFEMMSSVRAALATAKIPAMLEFIKDFEEQEEPLVVFSAHRAPIDLLAGRQGWRIITGDTPAEERSEIETLFQDGKLRGIGSTIKAGGVAITLTRASHALFVDREWTPALNAQAEDRICRIGQTRGCVITIIKANHILDERVNELLTKKQKLIQASVDASSVTQDAPDNEFENHLHRIQEEIASGRPIRRMDENDVETKAFNDLHTLTFADRDKRLAFELAEEAAVIGLSDAQWQLAIKLASRGYVLPVAPPVKKKTKTKKGNNAEGDSCYQDSPVGDDGEEDTDGARRSDDANLQSDSEVGAGRSGDGIGDECPP